MLCRPVIHLQPVWWINFIIVILIKVYFTYNCFAFDRLIDWLTLLNTKDSITFFNTLLVKKRKPSWRKGYVRQRRHSKMAVSCHLGYYWTRNSVIRTVNPEMKTLAQKKTWSGSDAPFARYLPFTILRPWNWRLGSLQVIESSTIRSTDPENLTTELNITSISKLIAKLWPFLYIQDGRQPPSWIYASI